MKIKKNSIITLDDNQRYMVITGEKLEDVTFCLISTLKPPIEMKVAELINNQGSPLIRQYKGGDYKYILKRLLDKAGNEKIVN